MKPFLILVLFFFNSDFFLLSLDALEISHSIEDKVLSNNEINPIAIKKAFTFYRKNQSTIGLSENFLAIADFSKKSDQKRLAIIHLKTGDVDFYKVAHGKGSDKNHDRMLDHFSDKAQSFATPKGFHKMTDTYNGRHGLSLKMQGLEDHNKTSLNRAIVLHGADYVSWPHTGRSQGCPAVEKKFVHKIIEQLKDGALFYHFKE